MPVSEIKPAGKERVQLRVSMDSGQVLAGGDWGGRGEDKSLLRKGTRYADALRQELLVSQ